MKPETVIKLSPNVTCLVVEDSEERNKWFLANLPHLDIAETPKVALAMLALHSYDLIFLDHDCRTENGQRSFVDPEDPDFLRDTFWSVAESLAENPGPAYDAPQIVIHSGNPVGAGRMAALLRSNDRYRHVYVMPFGSFKIEIER